MAVEHLRDPESRVVEHEGCAEIDCPIYEICIGEASFKALEVAEKLEKQGSVRFTRAYLDKFAYTVYQCASENCFAHPSGGNVTIEAANFNQLR